MLLISPTYANRRDLNTAHKMLFTSYDALERNASVRYVYRQCMCDGSDTLRMTVAAAGWLFAIVTVSTLELTSMIACMLGVPERASPLVFFAWLSAAIAFGHFVPYGWLLWIIILLTVVQTLFLHLMSDYGRELIASRRRVN